LTFEIKHLHVNVYFKTIIILYNFIHYINIKLYIFTIVNIKTVKYFKIITYTIIQLRLEKINNYKMLQFSCKYFVSISLIE